MTAVRKVRDALKRAEVALYVVTAVLGLYLAGGNAMRGAKWPDEATWQPWTVWFCALVAAALYVPLYALYKAIDAHFEESDKEAAEAEKAKAATDADLQLICQRVVSAVSEACPAVAINDLAAHVWLCRDDGSFDRRAFFTLPEKRKSSGIVWRKGRGVAGMAWEGNEDLRSDLRPLHDKLADLGAAGFDELPAKERHGLTAAEVRSSRQYTGVCAMRLFSQDETRRLLGIFIIDYMGRGEFDCVAEASRRRPISTYLAGCEEILSTATAAL
ncbi:MAG TPA: hypothetical protein VHG69_10135 [Thermoleophilaceae bacterium]|nr:hypothetical protein [Thermoleophilaceae bacterium]